MRQVLLTAILIALLFGALCVAIRADEGPLQDIVVERITQDPGADLDPAIAVGSDGRVLLAWKHYVAENVTTQIQFARSPAWMTTVITPPIHLPAEQINLPSSGQIPLQVAWSQPSTDTITITQQPLASDATPLIWNLPLQPQSVLAIDRSGGGHSVWVQGRTINYVANAQGAKVTLDTELDDIRELSLTVDNRAQAYLAWACNSPTSQASSIFVAALVSGTVPVEIGSGRAPKIAVGPSGRLHLAWMTDEGLRYANSLDWTAVQTITAQALAPDQFALAVQFDETAHLAWVEDKTLWRASARDWSRSRTPLVFDITLASLALQVDADGCPHLAWTANDDQNNADIYYLRSLTLPPKLRITFPVGGEMLTTDALVQAESNLAINRLSSVAFYAQVRSEQAISDQAPLISLGLDQNARDGWSVPLHLANLDSAKQYRIVALGTDFEGQIIRAEGEWFTVEPSGSPHLWVNSSDVAITRGQAVINLLAGAAEGFEGLDLFLTPIDSDSPTDSPSRDILPSPPPSSYYLGHYGSPWPQTWPAANWERIEYDSRTTPDGLYRASVIAKDLLGRTAYGVSEPFVIKNALFPDVEWVSPTPGAVIESTLDLVALARDMDGQVQRVEFYLERRLAALQTRHASRIIERQIPRLLWLGSDVTSSDGWRVSIPVSEALDGDEWYAWAVAFDEHGLAGSARSERFAIVGNKRPYLRLLSPAPDSSLNGDEIVTLSVLSGAAYIQSVQAFVEYPNGDLVPLGPLNRAEDSWRCSWNTHTVADGEYALVVVAQTVDGQCCLARSDRLAIQNTDGQYAFQEPSPGAQIRGSTYIAIRSTSDPVIATDVHFYYRDQAGDLAPIGRGTRQQDGWGILWDTATAFDGRYDLLAIITEAQGRIASIEQSISIHNQDIDMTIVSPRKGERWSDTQEIAWQIASPTLRPLSITLEYSPDAGSHWITIADGITATQSLLWNTTRYPDSARALVRLNATDGKRYYQATSEPFVLDNTNEAPVITLVSPSTDSSWGEAVPIVWQAFDPDGDPLQIRIEYQYERGAAWVILAQNIANSGRYTWDTSGLPAGGEYSLRITASDSSGAAQSDLIQDIRLSANKPPIVQLLWPNGGIRAQHEAIILWEASDPDGDALTIDLFYSDNAGQTWLPLAEGLSNTGYYVWQVSYLPAGAQYRVRIVARDSAGQTSSQNSGAFTVGDAAQPQITLLTPISGEQIAGLRLIAWSSFSPDQAALRASLSIRPVGQTNWQSLAESIPDEGFYLWDTRNHADGDYDLRVTVTNTRSTAYAILPKPISIVNHQNHPPEVTLLTPQGGEQWNGIREITWRAWDRDNDVITATLQISDDGGETWSKLASLDARVGRFLWNTRRTRPAPNFKLRIEVSDGISRAENSTAGVFYLTNRYSHPPTVKLTSPSTTNQASHSGLVTWVAEDADGDPLSLSLATSQDNGRTWREIARDLANTGEYALDAVALKLGGSCLLRIIADDGLYQSQDVSALTTWGTPAEGWPELTVEPFQETNIITSEYEIRWRASDPLGSETRISLDASRDGGQSWSRIGEDPANTGNYKLDTSSLANGIYLFRLTASNSWGNALQTIGPVAIKNPNRAAPSVAFIYPRGGEIWSGVQEIRWRASDADGDALSISLAYSIDEGANWRALAYGLENTGNYVWDTTTIPDCERVRLRISASDGRFSAQALSAGRLAVRNGHTPTIALLWPQAGAQLAGKQHIIWAANHYSGRTSRVSLELSIDGGQTWQVLAQDLPAQGDYLWDTTSLPERSQVLIRVTAADGAHNAIDATWQPIIVRGNPQSPALPFFLP